MPDLTLHQEKTIYATVPRIVGVVLAPIDGWIDALRF